MVRALVLAAGACVLLVQAAAAQSLNPCGVVNTFERAWGSQDVNGALGQFADTAVVTLENAGTRSLTGRDQIRAFLQNANLRSVPTLTSDRRLDGNTLMWSEHTDGQVLSAPDVTAQAEIRDGKIQSLIYRPGNLVRSAGLPAPDLSPESAGLMLAAAVLLGLSLLSLAGARRRSGSTSMLRGRLMHGLRDWRARPDPLT